MQAKMVNSLFPLSFSTYIIHVANFITEWLEPKHANNYRVKLIKVCYIIDTMYNIPETFHSCVYLFT